MDDAIVIGSGFGGAVAACRLAQAGFSVHVLERGRRYGAEDFPALPDESALLPDFGRWAWGADRGLWDIQDLGELVTVQSAGYGGGSLIYANVHLRPPPEVFDERWPKVYRNPETLDRYFDLAAYMLDVSPLNGARPTPPKVERLRKFADARGHQFFLPPLAITHKPKQHLDLDRPGCKHCAACSTGCPHGAKNSLDWNYLAIAERHGAQVHTLCEVQALQREGDRWEVTYFDHVLKRKASKKAAHVFLCTGVHNTTRLIAKLNEELKSKRESESEIIPSIGIGYHPNADAVGMIYDSETKLEPSKGPTIGASLVHWAAPKAQAHPSGDADFFLLQDGGYGPELDRALGVFRAAALLHRNRVTSASPRSQASAAESSTAPAAASKNARAQSLRSPLDALALVAAAAWSNGGGSKARDLLRGATAPWLSIVVENTVEYALATSASWPIGWPWRRLKQAVLRRMLGDNNRITGLAGDALDALIGSMAPHALKLVLNYAAEGADRRMMLLTMGRDATPGVLHYDATADKLVADLDLFHLAPMYQRQETMMTAIAESVGGELRMNPAWNFLGKPYTVHGQGGCRMADDPPRGKQVEGVTDPNGKVRGTEGLYILDGSLLCTSVGVNPSATILAIAERNIEIFINTHARNRATSEAPGAREYAEHRAAAKRWRTNATDQGWHIRPPRPPASPELSEIGLGIEFDEAMRGFVSSAEDADQSTLNDSTASDAKWAIHNALELKSEAFTELQMTVKVPDLNRFIEDFTHSAAVSGSVSTTLPGESQQRTFQIENGRIELFVPRYKQHALVDDKAREAQSRASGTPYVTRKRPAPRPARSGAARPHERLMTYRLPFLVDGIRWEVVGVKRVRQDPGVDAWDDTSALYIRIGVQGSDRNCTAGVVRLGPLGWAEDQRKLRVTGARGDPFRSSWARATFLGFFLGSLQQIYAPQLGTATGSIFGVRAGAR